MNLDDLKKPMQHQWRVQSCKEWGCDCVAYVDSRDVQRRLDDVCGPENWQDDYFEICGNVYCKIGIFCGDKWVWKSDCGTESNVEKEKGQASDAFKRAAVKWGVSRFLYDMKIVRLKSKKHTNKKDYPADDNGNIIWDKDKLSAYCEAKHNGGKPANDPTPPPKKTAKTKAEIDLEKLRLKDDPTKEQWEVLAGIFGSVKDIMTKAEACVEAYKLMDNHWPDVEKAGWVIEQLQQLYGKDAA